MADTVYILGDGINRCIRGAHDLALSLVDDFFHQALRYPNIGSEPYKEKLRPVFDYIARWWRLTPKELESESFDLASCFTLLHLQFEEALSQRDRQTYLSLSAIIFRLTAILAEYLSGFEALASDVESFRRLGEIIYREKPAVLTFNYDNLLERAIESASGVNGRIPPAESPSENHEITDEELAYSRMNWSRPLGYGVKFDQVQLPRAGTPAFVSGRRFYAHPANQLYSPPLLKLYGSINWFVYTEIKKHSFMENVVLGERKGQTILFRGKGWWPNQPDFNGIIIYPVIVTPFISKQTRQAPVIPVVWQRAKEELTDCRRLVIGGYSFRPEDFHARRLLLEAFVEHSLAELVMIGPDPGIVRLVKNLCHFNKPVVVCNDLEEFIAFHDRGN